MEITLNHYLILSAIIFAIGVVGVLTRKNILIIFMSVELMLNAANMSFIAFSHYLQEVSGMIFVFFTLTVAAAEVGIGLALVITLFRNKGTVNVSEFSLLKG